MNKRPDFTKEAIKRAKDHFLQYNTKPPRQFNIGYCEEGGWRCEFMQEEESWQDCTTWSTDFDLILDIFFSEDPDLIDLSSWEDEYDD